MLALAAVGALALTISPHRTIAPAARAHSGAMPRQPAPQPLLPVRRAAVVAMGPVEVPPEIREAEGKTPAASGRGLRFAAFAVLGALAVATGVIYLGSALGFEAVDDLADALVPFDNLYLGLAVDGGVITTCVWLWRQEETTREENVQRIWAEVQRRRAAPAKGKKEVGFKKKRKASRPGAATAASSSGFGSSTAPPEAA